MGPEDSVEVSGAGGVAVEDSSIADSDSNITGIQEDIHEDSGDGVGDLGDGMEDGGWGEAALSEIDIHDDAYLTR